MRAWSIFVYTVLHANITRLTPVISSSVSRQTNVARTTEVWCMFNNTASGFAIENARELISKIGAATLATRLSSEPSMLEE